MVRAARGYPRASGRGAVGWRGRGSGPRGLLRGRRELGSEGDGGREPAECGPCGTCWGWARGPPPPCSWCRPVALGWSRLLNLGGRRTPRFLQGHAGEGAAAARMGKTSANSCWVFSPKFAASLLPGGRRVGYGVRESGLWMGCRPVNSPCAFPGLPGPVDVCGGRSSAGAAGAAQRTTAGSGGSDPAARELEGTGCGLPGAGCIFPPVRGLCFLGLHLDWISEKDFAVGTSHGQLLRLCGEV